MMELYSKVSTEISEVLTKRYSTSFSLSSRLFDKSIRSSIYSIYGLVRIADEVVDTYKGEDTLPLLEDLNNQVVQSIKTNYSTNPIVHAFAQTANQYQIEPLIIKSFFDSMKMDIKTKKFTKLTYEKYIYGSAEVIGLMCLAVFTKGDKSQYQQLSTGARALGSAYQKVNFLRDMKSDYESLGRVYFPGVSYAEFSENDKQSIVDDIEADFLMAKTAIDSLPENSKKAVRASYYYYSSLLSKLKHLSAEEIKSRRHRLNDFQKFLLLIKAYIGL